MTNTKICPQCGEVNPVQAAVCPRCGRQFKTTAPVGNQQDEPKTVIGSFPPSFGQQSYSQSAHTQPPNFGNQSGYDQQASFHNQQAYQQPPAFGQLPGSNQQNFNSSNYNPPAKSSKAVWWILGGTLGVGFIAVLFVAIILIVAASNQKPNLEEAVDAKWQSSSGKSTLEMWSKNHRYENVAPEGIVDGSYTINGNTLILKGDNVNYTTNWTLTVDDNKMVVTSQANGNSITYSKIN